MELNAVETVMLMFVGGVFAVLLFFVPTMLMLWMDRRFDDDRRKINKD